MEVKLIKVLEHYHLYDGDKAIATTIVGNPMLLPNLSLKNCQAIELGYDLDDLAKDEFENSGWTQRFREEMKDDFIEIYLGGFKQALEIFGDKKFSDEDIKRAFEMGEDFGSLPFSSYTTSKRLNKKEYIQSLQQTEWDVEIVTITRMENGKSGLDAPVERPKLDTDNCLILKRK